MSQDCKQSAALTPAPAHPRETAASGPTGSARRYYDGRLRRVVRLASFAACVWSIHIVVRVSGFGPVHRWLSNHVSSQKASPDTAVPNEQARAIIEPVRASLKSLKRRAPTRLQGNCLSRSLALWWLLARRGIATTLHIGAAKDGTLFKAHAWVEYDGKSLNTAPQILAEYTAFEHDFARRDAT